MAKIKKIVNKLQKTEASIATAALAIFTFGLYFLDNIPSLDVTDASVLQANLFAVLDMIQ